MNTLETSWSGLNNVFSLNCFVLIVRLLLLLISNSLGVVVDDIYCITVYLLVWFVLKTKFSLDMLLHLKNVYILIMEVKLSLSKELFNL